MAPPPRRKAPRGRPQPKAAAAPPENTKETKVGASFVVAGGEEDVCYFFQSLSKQQQLELLDVQIYELAHVFIVNNLSFENREQAITEFMLHLNDQEFMTSTRMMFINAVAHNSGVIGNMDGRVVRFAVLSVFDKHLQRAYAREAALRPFFTWALCAFVWWLPGKWPMKILCCFVVMAFWGFEYPRPLTAFR